MTEQDCACKYKHTPRSEELHKDMVADNRYCGDVLTQLAAAESAIHRVSEMLLEEHMHTCLIEDIRSGKDEAVDELFTLMRRFN